MKSRVIGVLIRVGILLTGFGVSGQTLLTQAFLGGALGVSIITNTASLSIGATAESNDRPPQLLFSNLWVTEQDVGITYTMLPHDNPTNFALFTHYLTNNAISYFWFTITMGPGSGGGLGLPATNFFASLPSGSDGTNLAGFEIDYYTLEFTSLSFDSPGSNPNKDGIWTDCSYAATFSVYGQAVPEPSAWAIIFVGALGLTFARSRNRTPAAERKSGVCSGEWGVGRLNAGGMAGESIY